MTASILSDIIYRDITKYSKSTEQHYLSGYYTGTEYSKSLQAANELVVTRMEKPQGDAFRMVTFCQMATPMMMVIPYPSVELFRIANWVRRSVR